MTPFCLSKTPKHGIQIGVIRALTHESFEQQWHCLPRPPKPFWTPFWPLLAPCGRCYIGHFDHFCDIIGTILDHVARLVYPVLDHIWLFGLFWPHVEGAILAILTTFVT